VSDMNGLGPVVDLAEMHRRQKEKEQIPAYSVGTPEFALQVRVDLGSGGTLSFRNALDKVATLLDADGFTVEEFKHCAYAGQDQNGTPIFQVVARVSETERSFS
jgi:hypothetical protein